MLAFVKFLVQLAKSGKNVVPLADNHVELLDKLKMNVKTCVFLVVNAQKAMFLIILINAFLLNNVNVCSMANSTKPNLLEFLIVMSASVIKVHGSVQKTIAKNHLNADRINSTQCVWIKLH